MEHIKKSGVGAFLAGAFVATIVGGYMLFGSKNARRNRQKVEDWVENAKAEVAGKIRKIKQLSREKYYEAVDAVSDKYSRMKEVGKEKADSLREELRGRWDEMKEEARREADQEERK